MFKDLVLKPTYSSYETDIAESFYTPVLNEAIKYDRATAYFSAKALASYGKGIEHFARRGNHFRLIVSTQIDENDFSQMQEGYKYREIIDHTLLPKLRETLSLDEERNLSNLAYLISLGIIDIKMAFTCRGIFHDKFGILEDSAHNIICFRGSNNETEAAILANYESFEITCSWQVSEFDKEKITKNINTFNKLWSNTHSGILVRDIDSILYKEIMTHNRKKIINETAFLDHDAVVLDLEKGTLKLIINDGLNPSEIWNGKLYKLKLRRYLDRERQFEREKYFKSSLTYPFYNTIIKILQDDANSRAYSFYVTKRLSEFIESKELYILERSRIGIQIKQRSNQIAEQFLEYKRIVDNTMIRPLREQQMWDSFFMCTMKRDANFSVPGSGKTAAVLGVFAYLKTKGFVNKIVMVGPKNSFGSWTDEFVACFGEKTPIRLFDIHNGAYSTSELKKRGITFDTGSRNLLLFNYEGIGNYQKELKSIIDSKTMVVLDEVHKVKKYQNGIMGTRALDVYNVIENASYTIALTGTPIPNSYVDIYNLLHFLYRDEYDDFFGFDYSQLKNPNASDIEEINRKIQPFYCRTTKEQLGVPKPNPDIRVTANATELENRLFHVLKQKYRKNKLAMIIRLLQLEANPKMLLENLDLSEFDDILDVSGEIDEIDYVDYSQEVKEIIDNISRTEKFNCCIDKANEIHRQGKTLIIWCIFIDSIKRISKELERYGITTGVIYGNTPDEQRASILSEFKNGSINVLITNPHTLAESVSLHSVCHDAIYFEYSYNLVHLLQSKDRIHRLGLPEGQYTQYYFFEESYFDESGSFSLGEQIYYRLKDKEEIMLNAIENQVLEEVTSTEEDLEIIFNGLGL